MQDKAKIIPSSGGIIKDVYDNTSDNYIAISESKARIIYKKFVKNINGGVVWSVFSTAITCTVAGTTGEFQDVFNIERSGELIRLAFQGIGVAFWIFFVYVLIVYVVNKTRYGEDKFIEELKNQGDNT